MNRIMWDCERCSIKCCVDHEQMPEKCVHGIYEPRWKMLHIKEDVYSEMEELKKYK